MENSWSLKYFTFEKGEYLYQKHMIQKMKLTMNYN